MNFKKINHEATIGDLKEYNYPNQKLGVIVQIKDKDQNILLQQRGHKSRDYKGLYEDIGGKLEEYDIDFRQAIKRELKEEIGEGTNIEISNSIGIYHRYNNDTNWVFIIYAGKYIKKKKKIMEPDKCLGYKFFTKEEALNSNLVTESSKYLIKELDNCF